MTLIYFLKHKFLQQLVKLYQIARYAFLPPRSAVLVCTHLAGQKKYIQFVKIFDIMIIWEARWPHSPCSPEVKTNGGKIEGQQCSPPKIYPAIYSMQVVQVGKQVPKLVQKTDSSLYSLSCLWLFSRGSRVSVVVFNRSVCFQNSRSFLQCQLDDKTQQCSVNI